MEGRESLLVDSVKNISIFHEIGRCCQASFECLEIRLRRSVDAARRRGMSDPLSSPEWRGSGNESPSRRARAGKADSIDDR